jgi:hypothetical protein
MNLSNDQLIDMLKTEPEGQCASAGKKIIIVVPKKTSKEIADAEGNPVLDWEGKAITGQGFTFTNGVASGNGALQAVRTNGQEVIIINNPTQEQEAAIMEKLSFSGTDFYYNDGTPDPIAKIKKALEYAVSIGCTDIYNSDIKFVQAKMTTREGAPIDLSAVDGQYLANGSQLNVLQTKRDESKQFSFVQLKEDGFYSGGPTAKGEGFKKGTFAILDNANPEKPKAWLVEEKVFADTYKVVQPKVSNVVTDKITEIRNKAEGNNLSNGNGLKLK